MVLLASILNESKTDAQRLSKIQRRIVSDNLDIVILIQLREGGKSGYALLEEIHERFSFIVSSGTVYSILYALERYGLIKCSWDGRRRVCELTEKGRGVVEFVVSQQAVLRASLAGVFGAQEFLKNE